MEFLALIAIGTVVSLVYLGITGKIANNGEKLNKMEMEKEGDVQ